MRDTLLLILSLAGSPLVAQVPASEWGEWRKAAYTNDLTGAAERRLILRSTHWHQVPASPSSEIYFGSTLIIACGDRMVGDSGRTMLLFPGQAFALFGDPPHALVELRFSTDAKPSSHELAAHYYHDFFVYENEVVAKEWVAPLADGDHNVYSAPLLAKMLSADSVSIRYNAAHGWISSSFDLRGLGAQLTDLKACKWPLPS